MATFNQEVTVITSILLPEKYAIHRSGSPALTLLLKQLIPFYVFIMLAHLVGDLPLPLESNTQSNRMSFSRFSSFLLTTCPKYPMMRFSHRTLFLTGCGSSSMIIALFICLSFPLSMGYSTFFSRPTFQRHLFLFCHLPSVSMFFAAHKKTGNTRILNKR